MLSDMTYVLLFYWYLESVTESDLYTNYFHLWEYSTVFRPFYWVKKNKESSLSNFDLLLIVYVLC